MPGGGEPRRRRTKDETEDDEEEDGWKPGGKPAENGRPVWRSVPRVAHSHV